MSKTIIIGIFVALPMIWGVSFFVNQNKTSVQASQPETSIATSYVNVVPLDNSALLTGAVW